MSPTHVTVQSLAGKLFTGMLAFTLGVVIVLALGLTTIYYASYERDAEAALVANAQDAADYLNALPETDSVSALKEQFTGLVRYTLIAADGRVLYDSAADAATMGSHAERPEVQEARASGEAVTMRRSETLGTDTVYAAVKLDDGSIVRLSESRHSLLAFLGGMAVPVVIALAVAGVLAFVLSRMLTRRIMKPIDALNFADPLHNEIYEEMDPLLIRIDEQQRRLLQQNRELAVAENLRRDFSSNVSHEMKTPLQVISGYAELMKNDMVQPADRQKFAGLIYEEAQAMRSLINDVLTLSRLDESAFGDEGARVDLRAVAERVVGRLSSFAAGKSIDVRVEGASAFIDGSETLAEEMIYNLVENAIRYNHDHGSVTVRLEVQPAAPAAPAVPAAPAAPAAPVGRRPDQEASAPAAREMVVVRVRDTGPGIPEDLRDKIFERFFRIDKSRSKETGGTGLGLAIVKHAVLHYHGTIDVESVEDEGTTFILRLPAAQDS